MNRHGWESIPGGGETGDEFSGKFDIEEFAPFKNFRIVQLNDGRAGILIDVPLFATPSQRLQFYVDGIVMLRKIQGVAIAQECDVFWDPESETVYPFAVSGRAFRLGMAHADADAEAKYIHVSLNHRA